jgi:hypothetical protein
MTPTQAVLAAEADRYRAMVAGDTDALRSMCDPGLRYVLPSGEILTLDTWIDKISGGALRYDRIEHPVDRVEINGDVAVVSGRAYAYAERDGRVYAMSVRSLSVLLHRDATWQLLVFQATAMS